MFGQFRFQLVTHPPGLSCLIFQKAPRSFSILNDDFSEPARKTIGWPAFLSFFYSLFDSSDFLDYINTARLLSMIISSVSVFPMYLLARKFLNQKKFDEIQWKRLRQKALEKPIITSSDAYSAIATMLVPLGDPYTR